MIVVKKDLLKLIAHLVLIIAILALFTKLSIDAIILGAIAMYLYQEKYGRTSTFDRRPIPLFSSTFNN